MGNTILGTKYIKSLSKGIKSLEKNKLQVDNGTFEVIVENNIDNISDAVLRCVLNEADKT